MSYADLVYEIGSEKGSKQYSGDRKILLPKKEGKRLKTKNSVENQTVPNGNQMRAKTEGKGCWSCGGLIKSRLPSSLFSTEAMASPVPKYN